MAAVPDTAQLVVQYSGAGGVTAANVLNFTHIGGDFDSDTATFIQGNWQAYWSTLGVQDYLCLGGSSFRDLRDDPADEVFAGGVDLDGQATSNPLPAQCAICVSVHAGGGRRRRGRIYLPGIADEYVGDDSRYTTGVVTAAVDGIEDFTTEVAVNGGWLLAVYSRMDGVSRGVQEFSCDGVVDTQRRRVERLA